MLNALRDFLQAVVDEWKFMLRQPTITLVILAIPVIYPLIVSGIYQANQTVERPAAVVDGDNSALSRELIRNLDATQEVKVIERPDSVDKGWDALRVGRAELLVYIPPNLTEHVKRGEQAHIKLWVNSANMLTYAPAYSGASNVVNDLNQKLGQRYFFSKGMSTQVAEARTAPVSRIERFFFHPTLAYGDFLVVGVFMTAVQQVVLIGLAFAVGLRRELMANQKPVRSDFAYVRAAIAAQLALYLVGAAFVVWAVCPWFGWSIQSPRSVYILFAAFVCSMVPLAMVIANLMKDRYESLQVLMLISAPLFLMSGYTWPIDQAPEYVRAFASLFPLTPALNALRVLTMKSGDLHAITPFLRTMGVQFAGYVALAFVVGRVSAYRHRKRMAT